MTAAGLAVRDGSPKIRWHDLPSGKVVKQEELNAGVNQASRSDVYLRETAGGKWQYLSTQWPPKQLAFSPDGRWLAVVCDTRVYFFNTATLAVDLLLHSHMSITINAFAWTPDGASVTCGSDTSLKVTAQVKVWDVAEELEPEPSLARESFNRTTPHLTAIDAALSADGRTLVVGESVDVRGNLMKPDVPKGVVHVWSFPRLGIGPRRTWHTLYRIHSFAVSPDGGHVATAHEDSSVSPLGCCYRHEGTRVPRAQFTSLRRRLQS